MKQIKHLIDQLLEAEDSYYNGIPLMSDAAYDLLRDKLTELDPDNSHLKSVGAPVTTGVKKAHLIPMGSQSKAMNLDDFKRWLRSTEKSLNSDALQLHASYKADGGSISLRFVNGRLVEAVTRGSGSIGEDITHNAKLFKGIPKIVLHPDTAEKFNGYIRAEVVLSETNWKELDPDQLSNPRNIGNGIARRKDGALSDKLSIVAFNLYERNGSTLGDTQVMMFANLNSMGFETPPSMFGTPLEIWTKFKKLDNNRRDKQLILDYWIDGVVVSVNNINNLIKLGSKDNRPKGQVALKFEANGTLTELQDVVLSVGHTGVIVPTGQFKPVQISGTTVSSALLANWDNIDLLDIAIGDAVEIYKAGEIIPKVLRVVDRPTNRLKIDIPTSCPVCDGQVGKKINVGGKESAHLYCLNSKCDAQVTGKIMRYIKSLNILGIGSEVLDSLLEYNLIKNVSDLYTLKNKDIELAAMRSTSSGTKLGYNRARKIIDEIEKTRKLTIPQLLGSLGINHLGKRRVELIMESVPDEMDTIDKWFNNTLLNIAWRASIPRIATAIHESLKENESLVTDILNNGVTIVESDSLEYSSDAKSFCITGKLSQPKSVYEEKIKNSGNIWSTKVDKGLNYLVMADPSSGSAKAKKAEKLGVKCISEQELLELL